jgi:hypothetical protein
MGERGRAECCRISGASSCLANRLGVSLGTQWTRSMIGWQIAIPKRKVIEAGRGSLSPAQCIFPCMNGRVGEV